METAKSCARCANLQKPLKKEPVFLEFEKTPVKVEHRYKLNPFTVIMVCMGFFVLGSTAMVLHYEPIIDKQSKQIYILKLDTSMKTTEIRRLVIWKAIENTGNSADIRKEINMQKKRRLKKSITPCLKAKGLEP